MLQRDNWTPERIKALKRDWVAGLTASQIAGRLGGVTRNAVIGKVSRLQEKGELTHRISGFTRRARAGRTLVYSPIKAMRRVVRELLPKVPVPAPQVDDVARLSFDDLDNSHFPEMCRWIIGDPAGKNQNEKQYCGLTTIPGKPYCPGHFARAYTAPPVRRKAPVLQPVPEREKETA